MYRVLGLYGPTRNEPECSPARNPLPPNKMQADTGNAGLDGYSVLSRADRITGRRPSINAVPDPLGPNLAQEQ